jgi:hypothetical protein
MMNGMSDKILWAYDILKQRGFLSVEKKSYPLFKSYEDGNVLQEKSAAIITAWAGANNGIYKIIHGYLCHLYFYEKLPVYFVIHSPQTPDYSLQQIVDSLYNLSMEAGLPFLQIRYIEDRFLKDYEAVEGYDIKTEYRVEDNEYVYRIEDLLQLSGSDNYYKRKRIKKIQSLPDASLRPMTNANVGLCTAVQETWCRNHDCSQCRYFCGCEKEALEIMIGIFDDKIHQGLFLYREEVPVGYIICEKINETLGYLYFGKAIVADGFVYLIYKMFKEYLTGIKYMNMNDEMGNTGLRQFKVHLSAHELWKKNTCTFIRKGEHQ